MDGLDTVVAEDDLGKSRPGKGNVHSSAVHVSSEWIALRDDDTSRSGAAGFGDGPGSEAVILDRGHLHTGATDHQGFN